MPHCSFNNCPVWYPSISTDGIKVKVSVNIVFTPLYLNQRKVQLRMELVNNLFIILDNHKNIIRIIYLPNDITMFAVLGCRYISRIFNFSLQIKYSNISIKQSNNKHMRMHWMYINWRNRTMSKSNEFRIWRIFKWKYACNSMGFVILNGIKVIWKTSCIFWMQKMIPKDK